MDDFADDVGGRRMRKMCLAILLCAFLVVCGFALAASSVPERNQESEQRIASMEVNQSAGNLTGDDYVIALIYAYMQDVQNGTSWLNPGPIFKSIKKEALLKFPEYESVYMLLDNGRGSIDDDLMEMLLVPPNFATGRKCENMSDVPESNIIRVIYYVFSENGDVTNKARAAYQTRIAEEAELKTMQEKREAELKEMQKKKVTEQLRKQQENEARQIALDAHYKNVSENYSTELTNLLNQSRFQDALNLSNEAIGNLVSPYSNIMMINQGDTYVSMGMYEAAIESYTSALNNFAYSNESADYKENITQDFGNNWGRIIQMKVGMAREYRAEQLHAMAFDDLRDAPNVKQLLSGHISNMPKYEFRVINYTAPDYSDIDDPGYWVQINISAYNDPEEIDDTEYLRKNIPICVDMFTALFSDEQISKVFIQLNESYLDKFGHTLESPSITMRLNNETAAKIGEWEPFKKYIGTDMSRFEQVIDIKRWY